MSIELNEGSYPYSKISSLTIVDELIFHLVRGSTETSPCFTFGPKLPPHLHELREFLGLERASRKKWTIRGSMVISALYFVRSTYEVLNDCLPVFFRTPVRDQLFLFTEAKDWAPVAFVKNAKYFTAWPMARYNGQGDELERPESFQGHPLIFRGKIRKMLKQRLVSHNVKNLHLWGSFLLGIKRACYTVPEDFVQTSYEKHRKQMGVKPNVEAFVINGKFEETVDQILEDVEPIRSYKLHEASTSASFEKKRDEGGAREAVREFLDEFSTYISNEDILADLDVDEDDKRKLLNSNFQMSILRYEYLLKHVTEMYSLIDDQEYLNVMVHGICEPLKVRIITKGEAVPYWIARHMQKEMWGYLQNYEQFSATGRPLSKMDIDGLERRRANFIRNHKLEGLVDFDQWVSGDYSAATDGVNIHFTMMVFEKFCERLKIDPMVRDIIRKVIGPQMVHYPPKSGLEPILQQNGQLMGSVLSFPILCIINVAAYKLAMEEYLSEVTGEQVTLSLGELPVMVNGDDILFPANDHFYEFWKKNIDIAGFKLSLGKNYISREFLTINSEIYRFKKVHPYFKTPMGRAGLCSYGYEFEKIPTFNCGLLTGQSKLSGRRETRSLPIWDFYNEVIEGSARPSIARRRFFHYHRKWIEECTGKGKFNCYLPVELGGLGFTTEGIDLDEIHVTHFQRKWADYVKGNMYRLEKDHRSTRIGLVRINNYHSVNKMREIDWDNLRIIYTNEFNDSKTPIYPFLEPLKDYIHRHETTTPILWSSLEYTEKPEMVISIPWKTVKQVEKYHHPQRSSFKGLLTSSLPKAYVLHDLNEDTSLYMREWNRFYRVWSNDNGV